MLAQNGNASFSATVDIKDCMSKSVMLLRSSIFSQLINITHSLGPLKGSHLSQSLPEMEQYLSRQTVSQVDKSNYIQILSCLNENLLPLMSIHGDKA